MFALPISVRLYLVLKALFFNQNSPKMKLFLQKNAKFLSAGGSASSPQNSPPLRISGYAPAAYLCARFLTCKSTLNVAKVQYKLREASGLNLPWYGKLWNGIWKKIASMEYGKIVFSSIPYHVLRSSSGGQGQRGFSQCFDRLGYACSGCVLPRYQ